jgi:methylated-DNA-[protein]-cysteine S-methyltransferase
LGLEKTPSKFESRVYRALKRVPRGRVITYKGLAGRIGTNSARAVGNALARNPFPIKVPCHRVVASDRTIGGFQSGARVKKRLLKSEGIVFDEDGRIPEKFFV